MSMLNLHFSKIVKGYVQHFIPTKITIHFIERPSRWFLRKKGNRIVFNTHVVEKVKDISPREAVNFFDCLLICSLHYLKEIKSEGYIEVENRQALDLLRAPFYNDDVKKFLALHLAYTPRENYRNLEIADHLESYLT